MITLKDKISKDLFSSVSNLEYLVEITSYNEIIYISNNKQMFGTQAAIYDYTIINPSIPPSEDDENINNYSWNDGWSNGEIGINSPTLRILSDTCYKEVDGLEEGKTYIISIDVKDEPSDHHWSDPFKFYIGNYVANFQDQASEELVLGVNTFEIEVNELHYNRIGFIHGDNAIINDIYIREKGSLDYTAAVTRYYEDLDLKISAMKEKIDLKNKKIQLSNINLTLTNIDTGDGQLSDRLVNPMGNNIRVYLKTQSCETIEDCIQIAELKITRYDHDNKSVKINADDISLETFYVDLPKTENVLEKDINTFENYDLKPIPILFGELESAPAIPYVESVLGNYQNDNGIYIYFDTSAKTGIGEVEGVRHFNLTTRSHINGSGYHEYYDINEETNLVNCDSLQISMGNNVYSVNCLPYVNTGEPIRQHHYYPQYWTEIDKIRLITNHAGNWSPSTVIQDENIVRKNALWVHDLVEVPYDEHEIDTGEIINLANSEAYTLHRYGHTDHADPPTYSWFQNTSSGSNGTFFNYIKGSSLVLNVPDQFGNDAGVSWFGVGLEKFSFEPLGSHNVFKRLNTATGEDFTYPTDLSLVFNLEYQVIPYDDVSTATQANAILGYPSSFVFDPQRMTNNPSSAINYWNSAGSPHCGFPTELGNVFSTTSSDDHTLLHEELDKHSVREHYLMYCMGHYGATDVESVSTYRSYFTANKSMSNIPSRQAFKSYFERSAEYNFSALDTNALTFYYIVNMGHSSTFHQQKANVRTKWKDFKIKRHWAEAEVFNKDFFVNAKGRVSEPYTNIQKVNAQIKTSFEYPMTIYTTLYGLNYYMGLEHKHINELNKLLTEKRFKTKLIDGEVYDLILINEQSDGTEQKIFYDIVVNNLQQREDLGYFLNEYTSIDNTAGWIMDITAKHYGGANIEEDNGQFVVTGLRLAYGKLIFDSNELIDIVIDDTAPELVAFNNANGYASGESGGLTHIYYTDEDIDEQKRLVENPAEIIKNLLEVDMNFSNMNTEKYLKAFESVRGSKFAFSINEVKNSKDIIEKICEQSRLMFRYRPRDGMAVLDTIKDTYTDDDVDYTIKTNNLFSYSYTKSNIEDLCIGGCRVKYAYNYAKRNLSQLTDDVSLSDELVDNYKNYYGINDEENYILELDAPYIQDKPTAEKYRNYMFSQFKNQHLIVKFSMPIKDSVLLEVGDIINFDNNPYGNKPYGKDITQSYSILEDQEVYPYFLITSVNKNLSKIDIECNQLHNLEMFNVDEN